MEGRRRDRPQRLKQAKARLQETISGLRGALAAQTQAIWGRDRQGLRGWPALSNRALRIASLATRGCFEHRLSERSAALTYYTVFSLVPVLVLALSVLKTLGLLDAITPDLPAESSLPHGNAALRTVAVEILRTVSAKSQASIGIVGLLILLYLARKVFHASEAALNAIAESTEGAPRRSRQAAYLLLVLLPPAVLALAAALLTGVRGRVGKWTASSIGTGANLELAAGLLLAFTGLWLGLTIFYSAAARARIPLRSSAVGGFWTAAALPVVLWVFAEFQIGASRISASHSAFAVVPTFLLFVFSSWFAVLVGAEIAVAHNVERVLVHGAATFHLDSVGEQQVGLAIMLRAARAARGGDRVSVDVLARGLRVPPQVVRRLCRRLVARGFLNQRADSLHLACDPARTSIGVLIDAVSRDRDLDPARAPLLEQLDSGTRAAITSSITGIQGSGAGPSLTELLRLAALAERD